MRENCKAYGTRSQGVCPFAVKDGVYGIRAQGSEKHRYYTLMIPTDDSNREYFETLLKMDEIDEVQCSVVLLRKTSGDCPFYFAGGKCRNCKTAKERGDDILRAWAFALSCLEPRGLCSFLYGSFSDRPCNRKKPSRSFLQRFLNFVQGLKAYHILNRPEKDSLSLRVRRLPSPKQLTGKKGLPFLRWLKIFSLPVFLWPENLSKRKMRQTETTVCQSSLKNREVFLYLPVQIFLIFLFATQIVSQLFCIDPTWFFLASLLITAYLAFTKNTMEAAS